MKTNTQKQSLYITHVEKKKWRDKQFQLDHLHYIYHIHIDSSSVTSRGTAATSHMAKFSYQDNIVSSKHNKQKTKSFNFSCLQV
jgi:hypothetical protein